MDESNDTYDIPLTGAGYTLGLLVTSHITLGDHDLALIRDYKRVYRGTSNIYQDADDSINSLYSTRDDTDASPTIGSFLVTTAVPVPAAGWLFMSALIGLVGKKRLTRR